MKIRSLSIQKNRRYLLAFIFVMLMNLSLSIILLRVSFGQTKVADFSNQPDVKVKLLEQKDCPLQITFINVDNSSLSNQTINYSLQNLSNKSIRAYTLIGNAKNDGKIITVSFTTELFEPNKYEFNNLFLERETIKKNSSATLSVDYIEFEDGSSWGADSQGQSKEIAGEREGRKAAIKELKESIKRQNSTDVLMNLLKQDIKKINVSVPNTKESDQWKKGYRLGYKAVISVLQDLDKSEDANLHLKKLDEMEKIAN